MQRKAMNSIICGDAATELKKFADNAFDCCVTSPPYYKLRDYGIAGQIGLEETVEEYITRLTAVFHEVYRVLKPDGTLWINIADCYLDKGKQAENCKRKDLIGIPWLLAFALRADGWYWRQVEVWEKPNCMPESVRDRCTNAHEYILLFSKSWRYYFDYKAIQEPCVGFNNDPPAGSKGTLRPNSRRRKGNRTTFRGGGAYTRNKAFINDMTVQNVSHGNVPNETGLRRKRSVWRIATVGSKYTHYATFPPKLAEPCVLAGCRMGGAVLDPFAGTGTVGVVANKSGREYVLIDLLPANADICRERLQQNTQKGI